MPPFADDLAWRVEARGDDVIPDVLGGEQDDLGANDVPIRRRILAGSGFEFGALLRTEVDDVRALSWRSSASLVTREATRSCRITPS